MGQDKLNLSVIKFNKNSYIIVEGKQRSDYFFIIHSGQVRVTKEIEVVEEEGSGILHPGDFFGVISSMSSHNHIETVRALTDVSLISVHRDHYQQLIKNNVSVAMKIIEYFSRRMRFLDEALARLTLKNIVEPSMEQLFQMGNYYAAQEQPNQAYYCYYEYTQYCPNGAHVQEARTRMVDLQGIAKAIYLDEKDKNEFTRVYPSDTMIFAETMPGKELYILQKGSVKITKIINNNEVLLAVLKPGDIFGEMSLIEDKPRSASAIAFEEATLLAVNKTNFTRMVATQPQIIARLTSLLAERIWLIYKQLANTLLSDDVARLYDMLLIQLEKTRVPIRHGTSYQFDFGTRELISMVGLPMDVGNTAIHALFKNKKLQIVDNRIQINDIEDILKQVEYYRKMQRLQQARANTKTR